ncbi:MAG: BamA/TamA family outer membrane protein [Calditrichaceae bacterium]
MKIKTFRNISLFAVLIVNFLSVPNLNAQGFDNKPISNIIIVGNDNTHADIIERELLFSVGDIVSDSILNESKKRIENLWLFNRVEFYPLPDGKKTGLLISVTERLYIFPYPEFTLEDRDWKKVTWGFGLAHENFRGRNEKVYLAMLFGNRPGYSFSYTNPWVNRDWHLVTGFYLKKYSKDSREKFYYDGDSSSINEKHLYSSVSFGKYWTRYFYNRLYLARDAITVKDDFAYAMLNSKRTDVNYSITLNTVYDTRDLYAYPTKGWVLLLKMEKNGLFVDNIDYTSFKIDIRKYLSWHKWIFAARMATEQSIGTLPFYDKVYLGFDERVRGHFSEIHSGRHNFVSTFEIRRPIVSTQYFDFFSNLFPGTSTKNLKFGINAGLFAETGIAWHKESEFNSINDIENLISGFGAGIHIILPYIEVLRIDFAFDENYNYETILEVGMAF